MLKNRIISTLRFFDLQDLPVTLLELHAFLLPDATQLKSQINAQGELIATSFAPSTMVSPGEVAKCLAEECQNEIEQKAGFYCLHGRVAIVDQRLSNYIYGIKRERRIRRYIQGLRRVPFVRGVALAGSQALGQQKDGSDIDLFIIVDSKFLWLARTGVTAYFQILGMRRHGGKIANRFCLNHYLAGVKQIGELKNLYTAGEYTKLRPLVYGRSIAEFQEKNRNWIAAFFANFQTVAGLAVGQSSFQRRLELLISGRFGQWLELKLKSWQLPKIRQEQFILVRDDELSFHPDSKQQELLQRFFGG